MAIVTLAAGGCSEEVSESKEHTEAMNSDDSFESLSQEARREFQSKNYEASVRILEKGGGRWGDTDEYLQQLGGAYLANDQIQEAETAFSRALELSPSFENQFNLAECAFLRGDYERAKTGFEDALSHSPANPTYRSIAAFKVIVSAGLAGETDAEVAIFREELTPTGRHYLEIVRSAWDQDVSRATALLRSPKTNSNDAAPYIDTLRTSGIIQDGK